MAVLFFLENVLGYTVTADDELLLPVKVTGQTDCCNIGEMCIRRQLTVEELNRYEKYLAAKKSKNK